MQIVRSRKIFTSPRDDGRWQSVENAAVLCSDGLIVAIGDFDDFSKLYPDATVLGNGRAVLLPGFVNGHHHVGLTPLQLGSPDMPLELWLVTRMLARSVDLYLDTLYSAFEMIASGITTVQHVHGSLPGGLDDGARQCKDVLRAYDDIGMRASFSVMVRDQNRLVYGSDADFLETLPQDMREPMKRWFGQFRMNVDDHSALFRDLRGTWNKSRRLKVQLAPANLHWCSDALLSKLADLSAEADAPMHMHLLETPFQKQYALDRTGISAVAHLDRFGLLNSRMTLGHGVWLNEVDLDLLAEREACLCHNCSSNFRLRSGIAPLRQALSRGITVGLGIDEAGINDDRNMLQEMRMVLTCHRIPGMDEDLPGADDVLRMATVGGAATTPFSGTIGRIEPGMAADLVLVDWEKIAYPFLDEEAPFLDALLRRGRMDHVSLVMCDGDVIYTDGRFAKVDRTSALAALHDSLAHALSDDETERRALSRRLLPHVRAFYDNYIDTGSHIPYERFNSRQ
ncbi:amidohydrolase family protein [Rhizobium pusense]|uniref:amidohydrolase family protein n=1 Tax=Agrobacterium pusense TaxID=648995 RepID=UPI0024476DA1|nr:amidohydrolase family protein [Agrobacterium pusense]MDH2091628.1 amidohydrolase family protein [Agrobacterium pusense]